MSDATIECWTCLKLWMHVGKRLPDALFDGPEVHVIGKTEGKVDDLAISKHEKGYGGKETVKVVGKAQENNEPYDA